MIDRPLLTVAIPHYNRRRYAELAIDSVLRQSFSDYELLVADDGSADDSEQVLPSILEASLVTTRYVRHPQNLGYDRNVRFCLAEARGEYVMLLGNDDALADFDTLATVSDALAARPDILVTNFADASTKQATRRVRRTGELGTGVDTALRHFRLFSFTSGLIYRRDRAAEFDTDVWDTSIYYQVYLASRILASGGTLAGLDRVTVMDHLRIDGELVPETYRNKYKGAAFTAKRKHTGLDSVARVTVAAVLPHADIDESTIIRRIYTQLYSITYGYWLLEYRRVATFGHAIGVARDLAPSRQLREHRVRSVDRLALWALYVLVTTVGLVIPERLFTRYRHRLAGIVRSIRQRNR
jgi:glycosyltransferase involved in cell wall biosynthesis